MDDKVCEAILQDAKRRLADVRDMLRDDLMLEYSSEVDDVFRLLSLIEIRQENIRKRKK